MLVRIESTPERDVQRGSTLALALIVVTTMVVLAGTFLQFSSALTHRQGQASDQKRSFYIAEAGLAESVAGMRVGRTGRVGSIEDPVRFGNGLFWVDVTDVGGGLRTIKSIGMSGSARTSLDLVVVEGKSSVAALGLFSNGDLELPSGSTIDAYNSDRPGQEEPVAEEPALPEGEPATPVAATEEGTLLTDSVIVLYSDIGTRGVARVSSNGDITVHEDLGASTTVQGDLRPGFEHTLTFNGEADVTGSTDSLATPVGLPAVTTPEMEADSGYTHTSATPAVLPSVVGAYEYLVIKSNTQVTITGPSTVVLGDLVIEPGGELLIDTAGGPVDIYVTDTLDVQSDSYITMTEAVPDTKLFSLQYAGTEPGNLLATGQVHGLVFAPQAELNVASSFEMFGSLIASGLLFQGAANIHFDLALANAAERAALPSLFSWRIVELAGGAAPRGNPYDALGVDKNLLDSPNDGHEDQQLEISYYDRAGLKQTYVGMESGFNWTDVSQVVAIERDGATVGTVDGLSGIGGIGDGTGIVGTGKTKFATL